MTRVATLALCGAFTTLVLASQTPVVPGEAGQREAGELVTDRPDFTESTEVAPRGWMQWESGFSFDRTGGDRGIALGAPLLRIGLARRLELRLGTDGYLLERPAGERRRAGLADSSIGFKYKIAGESRFLPAFSVIPAVSMPTGHSLFSSGARDPMVKFALAKDMPAGFSVSGNVNQASLTDELGRFLQRAYSLSVGHGLGERLSMYGELYRFSRDERDGAPFVMLQAGLTCLAGRNTQFDFSVARRLTAAGPDWVLSFGFVTRRPMNGLVRHF